MQLVFDAISVPKYILKTRRILLNTQFSTVEIDALQFGSEFTTGVCNLEIVNLINLNYRHDDLTFNKVFMLQLIVLITYK